MTETQKPTVIVSHPLPPDWITDLSSEVELIFGPKGGQGLSRDLKKELPRAKGLLALLDDPVDREILQAGTSLRVITNMAVGYDNIDVELCTELGIPVGNTPGVLTEGTADLTVALLLAAARKLPQSSRDAREGRWSTWDPTGWLGEDLTGATAGIIGMGKIGTAVAKRLAAFDTRLLFTNRSPKPDLERELDALQVPLSQLLQESDFICLHVPLTSETKGMIDKKALRQMKHTAILINAARGEIVDTRALITALQKGWIQAAGLDVTDPEPLPPDHLLYSLENCLITPHIGSATRNTRRMMAELAVQNLLAGLKGKRLPHCVNPEVYEKSTVDHPSSDPRR